MRVAMIGTRGVPARYGGFETAIEEIGRRLVGRGHEVVVYCRGAEDPSQRTHLGMELVHLPAARRKTLETLSHTALSVAHLVGTGGADAAIVFNAANAPFVPVLRARGIPVAVHVDGLEWKRCEVEGRWSPLLPGGRGDVGAAGRCTDRRRQRHRRLLRRRVRRRHGAAHLRRTGPGRAGICAGRGTRPPPQQYHLVVARFEPENHVLRDRRGLHRSEPSSRSSSSARRRTPTSTPHAIENAAAGRPADPAARRCLGPGAARPALRQRPHLPARPLGRRNEPVAAAGHGRRGTA